MNMTDGRVVQSFLTHDGPQLVSRWQDDLFSWPDLQFDEFFCYLIKSSGQLVPFQSFFFPSTCKYMACRCMETDVSGFWPLHAFQCQGQSCSESVARIIIHPSKL
jgi:hypothetical protein